MALAGCCTPVHTCNIKPAVQLLTINHPCVPYSINPASSFSPCLHLLLHLASLQNVVEDHKRSSCGVYVVNNHWLSIILCTSTSPPCHAACSSACSAWRFANQPDQVRALLGRCIKGFAAEQPAPPSLPPVAPPTMQGMRHAFFALKEAQDVEGMWR